MTEEEYEKIRILDCPSFILKLAGVTQQKLRIAEHPVEVISWVTMFTDYDRNVCSWDFFASCWVPKVTILNGCYCVIINGFFETVLSGYFEQYSLATLGLNTQCSSKVTFLLNYYGV